jgi:hypothetical protein
LNANPDLDQYIAPYDQPAPETLAYLNTILECVLSFVEKRPTSAIEVLMFSLVAVLVVSCVLAAGTSVYWCFRFIDLRGHQAPTTTASLPNVADVTLPDPTIECADALPILPDPVQSKPENIPEPDEKALFFQNMVDTMTKLFIDRYKSDFECLSQQHSKKLEEKLRAEITKMLEENKSEVGRISKQYDQSELILREEFEDAIKASNNPVSGMRKDLASDMQSKFDSFAFKFESAIRQSDNVLAEALTNVGKEKVILNQRLKKSESVCEDLPAKLNNLELGFRAKLGKLEAGLKSTINDLGSKTQDVEVTVGKQQTDLKKMQAEIESQAASVDTAKSKDLEKKFNNLFEEIVKVSSLVDSKATTSALEDVCDAMERRLTKVGGEVVNIHEAVGSKVEQIAKAETDVVSIQKVLAGNAEQISKIDKDVGRIRQALTGKAESPEVESLKQQIANKVDATEWATANKMAKEGLLDLSTKVQARLGSLESQFPDKPAQRAQGSGKASVVPDLPVKTVHQPADGKPIASERLSSFHVPTIKVDPVAAARGEDALSQSKWAPRNPRPLAEIISPPLPTAPKTPETTSPSHTLSEPEYAQIREILRPAEVDDRSSRPIFAIPQVRLPPASTSVSVSMRAPQKVQHTDSSTGQKPKPTRPSPQVQSVPVPNGSGASIWGSQNAHPFGRSIDQRLMGPVRHFQMASPPSGIEAPYGTPRNGQPFGSMFDFKIPSSGLAVSPGAYQNFQSSGSLTESKMARTATRDLSTPPSTSMSMSMSTSTTTSTSRSAAAGLGTSQWAPRNGQSSGSLAEVKSTRLTPGALSAPPRMLMSTSTGLGVSQWAPKNGQSSSSPTELKTTSLAPGGLSTPASMSMSTSTGLGASECAIQNGQQPGPSLDSRSKLPDPNEKTQEVKKSLPLTNPEWAKPPPFSPSTDPASTLVTPSTSRAFPAQNQVTLQQDRSNGGPASSFLGSGYSAKQLALQNSLLSVRQKMGPSSYLPLPPYSLADLEVEIAANPNSPESLALIHPHSPATSPSVIASPQTPSPMDVSGPSHLTVGATQIPTQPRAMADQMANPVTPSEANRQNVPKGEGPGPNGGKVFLTESVKKHNRKSRTKWKIKKILSRFPLEQRQHARYHQDPQTLLFDPDSPWAWLNSVVTIQMRHFWPDPPVGWVAPKGPPPGPPPSPDSDDSSSETDEPGEW